MSESFENEEVVEEKKVNLFGLIAFCLVMIFLSGYFLYGTLGHGWLKAQQYEGEAIAIVQPSENAYELRRGAAIRGCARTYKFEVNGQTYTGPTGGWRIPASCNSLDLEMLVKYDVANPENNVWAPDYNNYLAAGIGGAGILFGVFLFFHQLPKTRKKP